LCDGDDGGGDPLGPGFDGRLRREGGREKRIEHGGVYGGARHK